MSDNVEALKKALRDSTDRQDDLEQWLLKLKRAAGLEGQPITVGEAALFFVWAGVTSATDWHGATFGPFSQS